MPRNSSGNYTLPVGNPVVTDTLIESANWANPTMADLGAEITNSLDRQGRGSMINSLKLADGSVVTPGLAFNSESSTGLYHPAAHILGIAVAGVAMALFGDTDVTFTKNVIAQQNVTVTGNATVTGTTTFTGGISGVLSLPLGTAPLPSLTFAGDPNTGMYSPGADQIAWATAGVMRGTVSPAGNWLIPAPASGVPLTLTGGGTTAPQLSLTGQPTGQAISFFSTSANAAARNWALLANQVAFGDFMLRQSNALGGDPITAGSDALYISGGRNVTINAPASGIALTLLGATAASVAGGALLIQNDRLISFADSASSLALAGFIWYGSGNQMRFGTANATRLTIDGVGAVTIGAPASGDALTLVGAGETLRLVGDATFIAGYNAANTTRTGYLQFGAVSSLTILGSDFGLQLATAGNVRLGITNAGNVAISAPSSGGTLTLAGPTALTYSVGVSQIDTVNVTGGYFLRWLVGSGVNSTQRMEASAATMLFDWWIPGLGQALILDVAGAHVIAPPNLSNTNLVPSTAWVQTNTMGGVGQVYTSYAAGARAFNTDYTNTSAHARHVCVTVGFAASGTAAAVVGGVGVATVQSNASNIESQLSFIVPPGLVYRVNTAGSPSRDIWTEC